MNNKVFCPYCGSEELDNNYNYDTANTDYECKICGETFTHNDIVYCEDCGEQIMFDDIVNNGGSIICPDCYVMYVEQGII